MPRGEFKQRYWFFADTQNIATCHVANSNNAIGSLPTLKISLGFVALFEKIYYEVPIVTGFSNIGEDVQYRCFN
jgi:hypothetical protein